MNGDILKYFAVNYGLLWDEYGVYSSVKLRLRDIVDGDSIR